MSVNSRHRLDLLSVFTCKQPKTASCSSPVKSAPEVGKRVGNILPTQVSNPYEHVHSVGHASSHLTYVTKFPCCGSNNVWPAETLVWCQLLWQAAKRYTGVLGIIPGRSDDNNWDLTYSGVARMNVEIIWEQLSMCTCWECEDSYSWH